jgi:glycosyltransferase involved in cell wall biosynthesis
MNPRGGSDLGVDIVISNYNYGEFLTDAVESACRQSHSKVNVVVVDDGSTDDSRERLRAYEGRVEIVLKENGGQASALNAGMARCQGEIVIFLDADDMLRPWGAERVAENFAADPDLTRVQFRMAFIDAAGNPTGETLPSGHRRAPTGDLRRAELAFPFDLAWLAGGGTAFRTEPLRTIFPIPERDYPRCGADWYVVHLMALLGEAGYVDEVCADYRLHGRNGYARQDQRLDLEQVRHSIAYSAPTKVALARLADQVGLERPERILSLSDLANRLISLRLEPRTHPIPDDSVVRLLADSVRAAGRRFDVSWPMKVMYVGWFIAAAVSPRPLVRRLGELLWFPAARRGSTNRLLGRLRRESVGGGPARTA